MPKVLLQELVDALSFQSDDHLQFVDRQTGQVEMVSLSELSQAEEGNPEDDPEPGESNEFDIATAQVQNPGRFVRLPSKWDVHDWQIMRDFAEEVTPDRLRGDLLNALHGSGAFRNFKDALRRYRRENDWYAYRDAALRDIAIDWCDENKIEYVEDMRRQPHSEI